MKNIKTAQYDILNSLDNFERQYIESALWSSMDESTPDGGEPMDKNYDIGDLSPEAVQKVKQDCQKFRATANFPEEYDETTAAHDFWLTRNRHGAGFWDGDWPEPYATELTELSESFGEVNLYVGDDGKLYFL